VSWIEDPAFTANEPFGSQTLPYGVVHEPDGPVVAVRVGEHALPLRPLADALGARVGPLVSAGTLDPLLTAGHDVWSELRERVRELVNADSAPPGARLPGLDEVVTRLPFTVGDYVDFYSSRHHAENAGAIIRPDADPLPPNWNHQPIGYHGRSGTVVVSGTPVTRPHGQRRGSDGPKFGPSGLLDIEAEVGFVCGGPVASRVPTADAAEHVFGVLLLNDWSARDIQGWEQTPLGPFLGKSFATSVSAWITPLDAFTEARVPVPEPAQPLFDYLVETEPGGLDLSIEVRCNGQLVSSPPFAAMNWSSAQQLAQMTINGAPVRPGDLFGSGTVSGPRREQRGCFLELSWGGQELVELADGSRRTFLEDGDEVTITATAPGPGASVVGLAEVTGVVRPADELPTRP
jgi:fumarylacetoacetase